MIHVGGEYQKNDGRTYQVGSFGCFGLSGKDRGNKGNKSFTKDIVNRRDKNKQAQKGTTIRITIEKRSDVKSEWKVDKNGTSN